MYLSQLFGVRHWLAYFLVLLSVLFEGITMEEDCSVAYEKKYCLEMLIPMHVCNVLCMRHEAMFQEKSCFLYTYYYYGTQITE